MNWYIGQDVVCVKDGLMLKAGEVVTIRQISSSICKCAELDIDVGLKHDYPKLKCRVCGQYTETESKILWKGEGYFRPLDSLADISELTEVLETTQPFEV
jgi:hypothetical protein